MMFSCRFSTTFNCYSVLVLDDYDIVDYSWHDIYMKEILEAAFRHMIACSTNATHTLNPTDKEN